MFWNKKLTQERDLERARADDALARLEAMSRDRDQLVVRMNKLIDDKQEFEKHARSLEALQSSTATKLHQETESLGKCTLSLDHFGNVISEIHYLADAYSPILVDVLKNNSTLKSKLKEAQLLIGRIFEKSKGSE